MNRPNFRRCCARCLNVVLNLFGQGVDVRKDKILQSHIAHGFNGELFYLVSREGTDSALGRRP